MTAVIEAARRLVAIKIRPVNDGQIRCQDCERSFRQVIGHFEAGGYICPISTLAEAVDTYDSPTPTIVDESPTPDQEVGERTFMANCGWCGGKGLFAIATSEEDDRVTGPCPTESCAATLEFKLEIPETVSV
jgi:hypothetical protein